MGGRAGPRRAGPAGRVQPAPVPPGRPVLPEPQPAGLQDGPQAVGHPLVPQGPPGPGPRRPGDGLDARPVGRDAAVPQGGGDRGRDGGGHRVGPQDRGPGRAGPTRSWTPRADSDPFKSIALERGRRRSPVGDMRPGPERRAADHDVRHVQEAMLGECCRGIERPAQRRPRHEQKFNFSARRSSTTWATTPASASSAATASGPSSRPFHAFLDEGSWCRPAARRARHREPAPRVALARFPTWTR
jgi:hypothetical protein